MRRLVTMVAMLGVALVLLLGSAPATTYHDGVPLASTWHDGSPTAGPYAADYSYEPCTAGDCSGIARMPAGQDGTYHDG